jgi:DNA polymerase
VSSVVSLDFETFSVVDLTKKGMHLYATHPSTEVLCAAYAFDDEPAQLWHPKLPPPERLLLHIKRGGVVSGWNLAFERWINNQVCTRLYDWPELHLEQLDCTMARSYAMGMPGSLENGAAALGITERKDIEGHRLMLQVSKPRELHPDGSYTRWDDEERLERLYKYCLQDVVVERAARKRLLPLSPYEQRVWMLDQQINDRGVAVDLPALRAAVGLVEQEKVRLTAEMKAASGDRISTCNAVQQIKDFLEFYGISGEKLDKAAVTDHLAQLNVPPIARRVLELRAEAGKAATSKFKPMVDTAGSDGRVRGCYQYSGANTRRWAGRRIQLQNLKRPRLKYPVIERVLDDLAAGVSAAELAALYGSPLDILGDCTRSFLVAAPGHELVAADFSAIEARVLAWLAGQESTLSVFRQGLDVYKVAAVDTFGGLYDLVADYHRQVGKVEVLSMGFGGGVGALQKMAKSHKVKMEPAFDNLWERARPDQRIRAEKTWESNKKNPKYEDVSQKEFLASDIIKIFWRENNPAIVEYWDSLEQAAIRATLQPGTFHTPGASLPPIKFKKAGSFLWCQLPGGGVICYPYPEVKEVKTPWGKTKQGLTYMAEDSQTHTWQRWVTYGGSLSENITQSVSRDLLADSMLRLDDAGYNIVLHTHDEPVCEVPKGEGEQALKDMIRIMGTNPEWAKGLPLASAGFVGPRYRK